MEDTSHSVRKDTAPSECHEDIYKQLYLVLNEYRFGRISFLELLEKWKAILQLPPSTQ